MFDVQEINKPISGVGGTITQTATKQGKLVCEFKVQDGTTTRKTIDVKYVPTLSHNLFSITEELSKGAKLSSNSKLDIRLAYPNGSILSFDRRIRTQTGWVPCIKFAAPLQEVAYLAQTTRKEKVNINKYHELLGHPN